MAKEIDQYLVRGVVTTADGRLARGFAVEAFDQDIRKPQELGRTRTDAKGEYSIQYVSRQFQQAELGSTDLVLTVSSPNGELLHTTDTLFNVPRYVTINIQLDSYGAEAEFDRIERELKPLLKGQDEEGKDIVFAALEENDRYRDITFAARETGLAFDRLMDFAVAHRLYTTTKLESHTETI